MLFLLGGAAHADMRERLAHVGCQLLGEIENPVGPNQVLFRCKGDRHAGLVRSEGKVRLLVCLESSQRGSAQAQERFESCHFIE